MDNVKSWIETGLRQMGEIRNEEDIHLAFNIVADTMTVDEWNKRKTIPIQIQYKKGMEIIKF